MPLAEVVHEAEEEEEEEQQQEEEEEEEEEVEDAVDCVSCNDVLLIPSAKTAAHSFLSCKDSFAKRHSSLSITVGGSADVLECDDVEVEVEEGEEGEDEEERDVKRVSS